MYKVTVKNSQFNGERCNVGFTNGVGLAENLSKEQIKFFKEMGYTVEGEAENKKNASPKANNNKGKKDNNSKEDSKENPGENPGENPKEDNN